MPLGEMLEIDRYAMSRFAQLQAEVLAHYQVYEFHPVVGKLQVYCSDDLGSFYLDILKDRLYTTAPKSKARRSAQTALYQISQALLRLMAPFLSFTAEEAWQVVGNSESIFMETYAKFDAPDEALLEKWRNIRFLRDIANKEIEKLRSDGAIGSSLQVDLTISLPWEYQLILRSLGEDLKYVFLSSSVEFGGSVGFDVRATPSTNAKCERCWHYRADVGSDASHPTICGRCSSNLYGAGEVRTVA